MCKIILRHIQNAEHIISKKKALEIPNINLPQPTTAKNNIPAPCFRAFSHINTHMHDY